VPNDPDSGKAAKATAQALSPISDSDTVLLYSAPGANFDYEPTRRDLRTEKNVSYPFPSLTLNVALWRFY